MYSINWSEKFRKDVKFCQKKKYNMAKFIPITSLLAEGKKLPGKYKDHMLSGNWKGYRELHIERNWLLIYRVDKVEKVIEYIRMGTHDKLLK